MAEADEEKGDSKDSKDFIATARKRLQEAIDVFDPTRKDQVEDIKFAAASPDNGWQWPTQLKQKRENDPNGPRPCLTVNKLPPHIKLVTNEQRQNRPSIKVLPVDDKADVEVANILNGIVRHVEANSDADIAYDIACEAQVTAGEGYLRVLTDYVDDEALEQDILIASVQNAHSVYLDPDGLRRDPTGRYCAWGFITDRVRKDDFEKTYPKAKEVNWELVGTGDQARGWIDGDYITIAEYFCVKEVPGKVVMWADGSVTRDDEMPAVAGMQTQKVRNVTRKKVMWTKMSPLEVLEDREWAGKYIPIVRVVGNEYEVDGKLVISGLVRNAKDAQRMVNFWKSQEAEMLALAPKAPFIGYKGQFENFEDKWGQANVVNYPYLEANPVTDETTGTVLPLPQRTSPPMPAVGFMQASLSAGDDLQATVGQYNPSLGADAKEKSGKAIVARQRQADVGTFHYVDNLARAIRQVGRIVIDLIPKIYDTRRVARILGEDGEPSHVTLDPGQSAPVVEAQGEGMEIQKIYNPSIGRYDVRVTTGPSYTTQRQEAAQMLIQLSQGVTDPNIALVMRYLAVKNMDWSGAEDLASVLKRMIPPQILAEDDEQASPEVQKAMQVIQQMQQQMQAMQGAFEQMQHGFEAQKLQIEGFKAQTSRMEVESKDRARKADAIVDIADHAQSSTEAAHRVAFQQPTGVPIP
jgi:hypothetical protein